MFVHIIATPFKHESRVLKECRAAFELEWGKPAMVVALWEDGVAEEELIEPGLSVWRVALKSRGWPKNLLVQVLKYFEWLYRIVARLRKEDLTIIHSHSVAALPVGVVLKFVTGARLVYDAHELESHANGLSPFRSRLTRWLERIWIAGADKTVTVCASIADWYGQEYSIERPVVIMNVPGKQKDVVARSTILRELHGIPTGDLIYLYQGALAPGRGVENLLQVFSGTLHGRHLALMGYGPLEDAIMAAAARSPNIHFQPAVPPSEVLHYTAGADIGLCLIENTCLSYYYSLPNKLFEYLLAGLPVMVNDMPEQRRIVEHFRCGWVVPESLSEQAALIESIDAGGLALYQAGAAKAAEAFDWEIEAATLRQVYSALVGGKVS
jgi:glycosyltransferase involved in cell wall biosynthesis